MNAALFDSTRTWLLENSIPENRSQTLESVQQMTGVDLTPVLVQDGDVAGDEFENPTLVREAYNAYRTSNRIARAGSHMAESGRLVYLGRNSTTRGSRMYQSIFDIMARLNAYGNAHAGTFMRPPMVISEEGNLNINAEVVGEQEHVLIQVVNYDGLSNVDNGSDGSHAMRGMRDTQYVNSELNLSSIYFNFDRYETAVRPLIERLEEAEWTIVEMTFTKRDRSTGADTPMTIPIGAIPHDTDERAGKIAILLAGLRGYNHVSAMMVELMGYVGAQRERVNPTVRDESGPTQEQIDEAMIVYSFVTQARDAAVAIERNARDLRVSVERRDAEVTRLQDEISSNLRALMDERRTLDEMVIATTRVALRSVEETIALPGVLAGMRQVADVRMNSNNGSGIVVEFDTHPYTMQCRSTGRHDENHVYVPGQALGLIDIPSLKVRIDLTQTSFNRATRITRADGNANGRNHPHISGATICWGDASTALAESFGRRDWESFTRLLLAWITQYNHSSPYHTFENWTRSTRTSAGWIVPETPAPATQARELATA